MEDKEVGKKKKVQRITRCSVPLCTNTNRTRKGIEFYCFPNEGSRRIRCIEWCNAIGIPLTKMRHKRVCMDHFPPEAFTPDYSDLLPGFNYKKPPRLIKGVVPSLLLPDKNAIAAAVAKDAESKLVEKTENVEKKLEASVVEPEPCTMESTEMDSSSPPPPKKRRIPHSTMLADLFLKAEVQKSCLICSKKNVTNDPNLYTFAGSNGFPLLNRQLWQTFVFRKLLKLPAWKYEEILTKTGSNIDPGKWLLICSVCKETVNTILKMEQEMRALKVKVCRLRRTVEKKFTESINRGNSSHNLYPESGFNIHYEIIMFVKNSRQGFLNVDEKGRSFGISDFDAVENVGLEPISQNLETVDSDSDNDFGKEGLEEKCDDNAGMDLSDDELLLHESSASHLDENIIAVSQSDPEVLEVEDVAISDQNDFQLTSKEKTVRNSKPLIRKGHNISGKFQCKICLRRYSSKGKLSLHMGLHAESRKLYNGAFDCFKCRAPYLTRKSLEYHFRNEHCMRLHESWDIFLPQEKYAFTQKTKKEVIAKLINEGKVGMKNTGKKVFNSIVPLEASGKLTGDQDEAMHEECSKIVENFEQQERVDNGKKYSTEDNHENNKSDNVSDEEWQPDADDASSDEEMETAVAQNDSFKRKESTPETPELVDEDLSQIE